MAALGALGLLGIAVAKADSTPPVACKVTLGGVAVELSATANQLDIAVLDEGSVRTRMEVPVEGPLRACWTLDANADGKPELLASTAPAEPGQAPMLRAWTWTGEWFESLALAPLDTTRPLPPTVVEAVRIVGGELVRSFTVPGQVEPVANFRYDFAGARWIPLKALRPGVAGKPRRSPDDLLQAPVSSGAHAVLALQKKS